MSRKRSLSAVSQAPAKQAAKDQWKTRTRMSQTFTVGGWGAPSAGVCGIELIAASRPEPGCPRSA